MADVSLRDIYKSFGKNEVIHGISCDIHDGEFIVILGPSGCGKSTVLRMIAGLEVITEGEIAINGSVVNQLEPADRDIAMVFQNYALYPHMTVFNNMAYGLKIRRMPKAEIEKRVQRAAEILELTEFLNRKPRQLSGGPTWMPSCAFRCAWSSEIFMNPSVLPASMSPMTRSKP
jgi:sn-glycerol 3-phosphate transport system ATP-binding protein